MKDNFNNIIRERIGAMPRRLGFVSILIISVTTIFILSTLFFIRLDAIYSGTTEISNSEGNDTFNILHVPENVLEGLTLKDSVKLVRYNDDTVNYENYAKITKINKDINLLTCKFSSGFFERNRQGKHLLDTNKAKGNMVNFLIVYKGSNVYNKILK